MTIRRPLSWTLALLVAIAAPAAVAQLRLPSAGSDAPRPALAPQPAATVAAAPAAGPQLVDRVVAVVNSEAITERELALRVRSISSRAQSQGMQLPSPEELQRQVLERMIAERAAIQAARDAGLRMDEVAIDRAVARIAQDNQVTVPQLRQRIESEGGSFTAFRQEIGAEMTISRLREREVDARIQVSEAEIDALLAAQAAGSGAPAEYNIAQIMVRVPETAEPEAVERARERAEAIAREARAGTDLAKILAVAAETGEGVTGGVIGMRPADRLPPVFVQAVEPLTPGQVAPVVRSPAGFHVLKLMDRRGAGAGKLGTAPVRQTRARHILVRINEINPEPEVVRRLTEIRERIEAGTVQFADMARQYSVDGSASQGGDLGWVYPGDTVPEFERAMDALSPGSVSGPVRTPFGYHLIQVVDRRTDEATPDRVRAAARNVLRERKAAEAYQEWMSQLRDRAYVEIRLEER